MCSRAAAGGSAPTFSCLPLRDSSTSSVLEWPGGASGRSNRDQSWGVAHSETPPVESLDLFAERHRVGGYISHLLAVDAANKSRPAEFKSTAGTPLFLV